MGLCACFLQKPYRLLLQHVLGPVDGLVRFALGLVDSLFDLVLGVVKLLFDLTGASVGTAFGLQVLVTGQGSDSLFASTLHLINLPSHVVQPSLSAFVLDL